MTIKEIEEAIRNRLHDLKHIKVLCEKLLADSPEGHLLVRNNHGNYRYLRDLDNKTREYLGKDKKDIIRALENKNYYLQLDKVTTTQEEVLQNVLQQIKDVADPEQVFVTIDKRKTHLIKEVTFQAKYILKDSAKEQFEMPIADNVNYVTKAGERVRSKSELIIANMLYDEKISYGYEISNINGFHPDFTVVHPKTGKVFYWEHFGMMDDSEYLSNCISKLQRYALAGFVPGKNLIVTFESIIMPLNTAYIKSVIKDYLIY